MPANDALNFHGVVSFDEAGAGKLAVLYPAPNVVVMLAAVLTHGVLVESAKEHEKQRTQEAADKVVDAYRPILDHLGYRALLPSAISAAALSERIVIPAADFSQADMQTVFIEPIFSMTQDQRAIVLDNVVSIYRGDDKTDSVPLYRVPVRVVSSPLPEGASVPAYWTNDDGRIFFSTNAALLGESLKVALRETLHDAAESSNPEKTFRYLQGGAEKIERAQLVSEACDRIVLRTLRGWLMSVPPVSSGVPCDGSAMAP